MSLNPSVDDNGPNNWLIDPVKGWPKCDYDGSIMIRDEQRSAPKIFAALCTICGWAISFDSCSKSHRYCAYQRLMPDIE